MWPRGLFYYEARSSPSLPNEEFIKQLLENGRRPFSSPLTREENRKNNPACDSWTPPINPAISTGNKLQASLPNATEFDVHPPGRRRGLPYGGTGQRFYGHGEQRVEGGSDRQSHVQGRLLGQAGRLPHPVHLPSASLAAGGHIFFGFQTGGVIVIALRSIINFKSTVKNQGSSINGPHQTHGSSFK